MAFRLTSADVALTISTVSLLLSGYAVFRKRPRILVEEAYLILKGFPDDWKGQTADKFLSSFIDFEVEIMIANYMAEAGSISKPNLKMIADGKSITVKPVSAHVESEVDDHNPNVTSYWTVRHGRSFTVGPYGREDDRLKYTVSERPDDIEFIVNNYDNLKYELEYRNHKGKLITYELKRIVKSQD
jgi:hypothetical protein